MDSTKIAVDYLKDLFISSDTINGFADSNFAKNYTSAFADARKNSYDYFCLVSFSESDREVSATLSMYSGRTGKEAAEWKVYRTGNDRFVSAFRYLQQKVETSLPTYGKIIDRKNSDVLVDIGKKDGLNENTTNWLIVKKDAIKTADSGIGISFSEDNILGNFSVETIGEEISSGRIAQKGLYDKINVGDYVIPVVEVTPLEEENPEAEAKTVAVEVTEPVLLQLLRNIRN